jgi:hypothetical protein
LKKSVLVDFVDLTRLRGGYELYDCYLFVRLRVCSGLKAFPRHVLLLWHCDLVVEVPGYRLRGPGFDF